MRDENFIVLDFLPKGRGDARKPEPVAQVIGERFFSLLEVIAKEGATLKQGDKVYIGEGERKDIDHIKRRLSVRELTTFARSELPFMIEKIVNDNETRYVSFFNNAQPITTRLHQLELLPGIGNKHMWGIISERKKGPFKSFEDLKNRVKLLPDPKGMVIKRITMELENENERFRLFVLGPPQRRF